MMAAEGIAVESKQVSRYKSLNPTMTERLLHPKRANTVSHGQSNNRNNNNLNINLSQSLQSEQECSVHPTASNLACAVQPFDHLMPQTSLTNMAWLYGTSKV
jgi:hypothetical protein